MNRNYYELAARYDARKSFGGKALVEFETVDGVEHKTLISYGHEVVRKRGDNVSLTDKWDFSSTTLRHVKEFLLQEGVSIGSGTKKQIADYFKDKIESE